MRIPKYTRNFIAILLILSSLMRGEGKAKERVYIIPGSHLDLFWMGTSEECLKKGSEILKEAIELCKNNSSFKFLIDSVVFVEYLLKTSPEYKDILKDLIKKGQVEVAVDYVDRLENQVGGESLIRQVFFGKNWLKENLGVESVIAHHPDLPGVTPQMPQIYNKCGVKYYLHGRGGFPDGLVYRWKSPDGSSIISCHYPLHYAYYKVEDILRDYHKIKKGFPLSVILAGLSGDLAPPNTMGGYSEKLTELIERLNREYPFIEIKMATPSDAIKPYEEISLPIKLGEIPSVWGSYGSATSVDIFILDKKAENALLTLEKLLSLLKILNLSIPEPQYHQRWEGLEKGNYIPKGKELSELWRMELFTQDHNYAGKGALISESFKLETKEKIIRYATEWINECLAEIKAKKQQNAAAYIILFNPLSWKRLELLELDRNSFPEKFYIVDSLGKTIPYEETNNKIKILTETPPIGYRIIYVKKGLSPQNEDQKIHITSLGDTLEIANRFYRVQISVDEGEVTSIFDKELGEELLERGRYLGRLNFYKEEGTDVAERSTHLEINWNLIGKKVTVSKQEGKLSSTIRLKKHFGLLNSSIEEYITLYKDIKRIDLRVIIYWGGIKNFQVRFLFPFRKDLANINYGVPFYTIRYPETIEGIMGPWKSDEVLYKDWKHIRDVANWIDLSNNNFGVTLSSLSTSYYIDPGNLEAILFRTVNSCGDQNYYYNAEYGKKLEFEFRITSDRGDYKKRRAYQKGPEILNPIITYSSNISTQSKEDIPEEASIFTICPEDVVVTSIQPVEKGFIIRYYNVTGQNKTVTLIPLDRTYAIAREVNLIEAPFGQFIKAEDGKLRINTGPYEIKTLLIERIEGDK